jgi:GT2 family glycosyltransferase
MEANSLIDRVTAGWRRIWHYSSAALPLPPIMESDPAKLILRSRIVDPFLLRDSYGTDDLETFRQLYFSRPWQERPRLSWYFDPQYYFDRNSNVANSGIDPFYHFIRWGATERRSPHPLINLDWLFRDFPQSAIQDNPANFLGILLEDLNVSPHPYMDLDYCRQAGTWKEPTDEPFMKRLLQATPSDTLDINPFFNVDWYRSRYRDVPAHSLQALIHFTIKGDFDHRFPSDRFDPDWYLQQYPDVQCSGIPPLFHFLAHGQQEGRLPMPNRSIVNKFDFERERHSKKIELITPPEIRGEPPTVSHPDGADEPDGYARLTAQLVQLNQRTLDSFVERDVLPVHLDGTVRSGIDLRFELPEQPKVSIIIPCYNELPYTLECLHSLAATSLKTSYEVIIADDASPDPNTADLAAIPGVRYLRQEANSGFLKNMNSAFASVRGEYIFLLNNDAQLVGDSLDILTAVLDSHPDVGAAGPKILFPNGRLQEAGCTIEPDGSTSMVGLFDDPDAPQYNYSRDVPYCSAAALLVRKGAVGEILFGEDFAPAYCEDVDLCLRIAANGYRVIYEPAACVVHHLSVSTAKAHQFAKVRQVRVNQQQLMSKWATSLAEMHRVRVLAFYLPQFHPIAENDLWWGKGFTEWRNVAEARPCFHGHYQPHTPADLGFYDLRMIETFAQQALLAQRYGVDGFCMYYYNFAGRRILERPLNNLLDHPEISFPFCICWANENWSRRWDGGDEDILMPQTYDRRLFETLVEDLKRLITDPRYIKVNGKPLFVVYRPALIPGCKQFIEELKRRLRYEVAMDLHSVYVESMELATSQMSPNELGFDGAIEFPPQGIAVSSTDNPALYKSTWQGKRYDYESTVLSAVRRSSAPFIRYPGVFPSWDNTPRQPNFGTVLDNSSPAAFQLYVEAKLDHLNKYLMGDNRLLFVNAWNEWAEGAHLEPDRQFGHQWLEALRAARINCRCHP